MQKGKKRKDITDTGTEDVTDRKDDNSQENGGMDSNVVVTYLHLRTS